MYFLPHIRCSSCCYGLNVLMYIIYCVYSFPFLAKLSVSVYIYIGYLVSFLTFVIGVSSIFLSTYMISTSGVSLCVSLCGGFCPRWIIGFVLTTLALALRVSPACPWGVRCAFLCLPVVRVHSHRSTERAHAPPQGPRGNTPLCVSSRDSLCSALIFRRTCRCRSSPSMARQKTAPMRARRYSKSCNRRPQPPTGGESLPLARSLSAVH